MLKLPRLRRRLISELSFSTAQAARQTGVFARLLLLLLVPGLLAPVSPVSPLFLQEKIVVSTHALLFSPGQSTWDYMQSSN
jgi:hypothetical protein